MALVLSARETTTHPVGPPARRPTATARRLRGAATGLAAGVAVAAGWATGAVRGPMALLVVVLVVLAVPTSRHLARRVLLAGCLIAGWLPLLWWVALPLGPLGRSGLLVSGLVGLTAGWAAAGTDPRARLRRVVPQVAVVDLLPPAAVAATAAVLLPWVRPAGPAPALGMLLGGYDHVAHFGMVHQIRATGVTVDGLPPGPQGPWHFATYPQAVHAVLATVEEILVGPVLRDPGLEVVVFARANGLLVAALAGVLVAAPCALPALRRRPAVVLPAATAMVAVLVLGPGALALRDGFVNFALACVLVVAVAAIAVATPRVPSPLLLAALGGGVVAVAGSWALLLVLALPAAAVVLLPPHRARFRAPRGRWVACAAVVGLTVVGVARSGLVIARTPAEDVLLTRGGITAPDPGTVLVAVLGCAALCLALTPASPGRPALRRARALVGVPAAGAVAALLVAWMQLAGGPSLTYYFFKLATGVAIVALALSALVGALLVARAHPGPAHRGSHPGRAGSRAAVAVLLAVVALQVFGLAGPDLTRIGLPPSAPGVVDLAAARGRAADPPPVAGDLLAAASRQAPGAGPVFFADVPSTGAIDPRLAAQWYLALTDTWSEAANRTAGELDVVDHSIAGAADSARRVLRARPDATVLVGVDAVGPVRALLPPDLAPRVVAP